MQNLLAHTKLMTEPTLDAEQIPCFGIGVTKYQIAKFKKSLLKISVFCKRVHKGCTENWQEIPEQGYMIAIDHTDK